jgi:hypothetical protein
MMTTVRQKPRIRSIGCILQSVVGFINSIVPIIVEAVPYFENVFHINSCLVSPSVVAWGKSIVKHKKVLYLFFFYDILTIESETIMTPKKYVAIQARITPALYEEIKYHADIHNRSIARELAQLVMEAMGERAQTTHRFAKPKKK